jgi:hypothetical protein
MRAAVRLPSQYAFVRYLCAYCGENPCRCALVVHCVCVCGATLEAGGDLLSKKACAEKHHYSARHRAWSGW